MFRVSVIIPVYNAEKYIGRAIESVVRQEYVHEVILVEDGFPDDALAICKEYANQYQKVKLFRHPNGENRGASASRNLGIEHASCEYIAFLDADDFCLPGRFLETKKAFENDPDATAVYEPIGTAYESEQARNEFCRLRKISPKESENYLTYTLKPLQGEAFFRSLLLGDNGYPSTDGITIKKAILKKAGMFSTRLQLDEDTDLWIRIAWYGKFVPGAHINPVAVRWVHADNRITKRDYHSMYHFMKKLRSWLITVDAKKEYHKIMLKRYYVAKARSRFNEDGLLVKIKYNMDYILKIAFNPALW
ncbi:glycosyl transferase family 2 [Anseongella ginsenosidimutans]|uniref:Glycosyl transferase family 2 n=1 Tax=Anseongella ginsenosidimutans TaxID=496056 RepID=A0A4R3KLL9_9SPHI|nr:glycosyltransferase family 2 protein [Anseongella ginsenosidimutans]QEC52112.1 glycosyltransferase family 2 protein [Anseongella ginsenosidimutans]TCS84859.1 glycosyl transferase family 2 [Anseongella ginsenosidimutans]